jgi:hypothetical protein
MGCTDIDYCIYDICGLWMALVYFYGYVYGHVYGCMFMDVCLWMCLGMCLGLHLWLCVWVSGLDPPRGLVQQISGLTSPWGPFPSSLGLTPPRGPFRQILGLTPPRGPFLTPPRNFGFSQILLHEAHLDDSSNFSNFSPTKMEKFAPVCSVE